MKMPNAPDAPLLIEPGGGSVLSYDGLLKRLKEERAFSPLCCERRPSEILVALAKAMAWGRRLTLIDPQLTALERMHCGVDGLGGAAEETLPALGEMTVAQLIERCRTASDFQLELITSGSTGLPKRVIHRLESLTRTLRLGERHGSDVWALCYNASHIAGVQVLLQAFFNGNPIIDLFGVSPAAAWCGLRDFRMTHLSATPTFFRLLLAEAEEPNPAMDHVTVGGEVLERTLLDRLRSAFPAARIRNHYATTESGTLLVSEGDVFTVPASSEGRVKVEGGTLRVHRSLLGEFREANLRSESGNLKPEERERKSESGELGAGGEKRPDFSVSGFSVSGLSSNWYDTGDLVEVVSSEPLRVRIAGRDRDWVNVGGEKINPLEVEKELRTHPAVSDAQVYGRPNSVVGHILCAQVVARGAVDELTLRDFLASRLHSAKVPRLFEFVSAIERTRTGKTARRYSNR